MFTPRSTVAITALIAFLNAPPIASPTFVPIVENVRLIVSQMPPKNSPTLENAFLTLFHASVNFC
jgi:ureidoglycolate hydrolase